MQFAAGRDTSDLMTHCSKAALAHHRSRCSQIRRAEAFCVLADLLSFCFGREPTDTVATARRQYDSVAPPQSITQIIRPGAGQPFLAAQWAEQRKPNQAVEAGSIDG
jgi:hypothetical protein